MQKYTSGWISLQYVILLIYVLVLCLTLDLIYKTSERKYRPKFATESSTFVDNLNSNPIFESYIIPEPDFLVSSHSSTFEVLPNNELIAFWFAGSHEGKPDVKIWSSRFINNQWTEAVSVISPEMLSDRLSQFVRKVGNPVVYRDQQGVLNLFVVSVGAIGGWSVSNINHLRSYDNGNTWKDTKRLVLSPFFNISTLIRTRGIPLQDGGFYLPIYDELLYTYPELLRFDKNGNFIEKRRMSSRRYVLQPAVVANDQLTGFSYLRNKATHNNILYMQSTEKAGRSWSRLKATNLTNRDSSLAVIRISESEILMVHNPDDRSKLILSISEDGINWKNIAILENTPGQEYSYPSIQIHDGLVDILYTYQRQRIKHVRFNWAWLKNQSA